MPGLVVSAPIRLLSVSIHSQNSGEGELSSYYSTDFVNRTELNSGSSIRGNPVPTQYV